MALLDFLKTAFNNNPFKGTYKINRMRPPGAVNEERFMKLCIRCSRCVEVCPYGTLKRSNTTINGEIGTPFIYPEYKACQLCMMCTSVCPTGAIDNKVVEMEDVSIGLAKIDTDTCLNYKYASDEETGNATGESSLCNTCFNSCPLKFEAIYLKDAILPTITEKCTGCGLCVERCPNKPKSVSIIPKGMNDIESIGYYNYLKKVEQK